MTKTYHAYTEFRNKVNMFGDPNQCEPVESGSAINDNYLESTVINEMCGNIEKLEYIEKTCRYDKQTHDILNKSLRYGKVSAYFEPINNEFYKNICYLNSTRIKVNRECCDRFIEENNKRSCEVKFTYNNKRETYYVCTKMPVLATQNMKDKGIHNTMEFVIEDIKYDRYRINNEWFDKKDFSENFIPSFCVTVYKYEGADINEPCNIYDVNLMDKKQLYTALSRTTKFEYIHLNNKKLNNKYFNRKKPKIELRNSKFNVLYKNGKIYRVMFSEKSLYIGSTCEDLQTRFNQHLVNNKSQVFKHKDKKPKIELIVNAPSKDKRSLENMENGYIEEYAEKYGQKLLNVKCNPKRKTKKIEYKVEMENETQLKERVAKLEKKLTIKDDEKNNPFYFDAINEGKRIKTMARYMDDTKESALEEIKLKKEEKNQGTNCLL